MGLSVTVCPQFTSGTDDDRQTDCILRRRRQQLCEQLVKFPNLTPLVKNGLALLSLLSYLPPLS